MSYPQPFDLERLTEIEESHPGPDWYGGEWRTEYVEGAEDQHGHYTVKHHESGTVLAELPDFAGTIALFIADAHDAVPEMAAEIRRLRADAAAELLPVWEAVYEPGNVSDYLIGYTNDEAPAKAAAEAWLRSQAKVTGRLEWEPWGTATALPDGYDAWFELSEHHDDGIPTGPGLIVRRRAAKDA
jgi:hypothetical protein